MAVNTMSYDITIVPIVCAKCRILSHIQTICYVKTLRITLFIPEHLFLYKCYQELT